MIMKNLIATMAGILLGLVLISGCQSADNGSSKAATGSSSSGQVSILLSKPKQAYTELGKVSTNKVQPDPSQNWQNILQRQASARGADAVIVDTSTLNNSYTPLVSGMAIRYERAP
jgi:hypothetical protein